MTAYFQLVCASLAFTGMLIPALAGSLPYGITQDPANSPIPWEAAGANLESRVDPVYPPLAKMAKLQGAVKMQVTVTIEGAVENVRVRSGHPLLVQSAIDAVRKWKFRPFLVDDKPVATDVMIEVPFVLEHFDKEEWDRYQQSFPLMNRGRTELRRKDYAAAHKTFQELLALSETLSPERYLTVWHALQGLGHANLGLGRVAEAGPFFERSVRLLEEHMKPDEAEVATALLDLANFHQRAGEPNKSRPLLVRAASIWEARRATTDLAELKFHYGRSLVETYFRLALFHRSQEENQAAESFYQKALEIGQGVYDAAELEPVYNGYAGLLQALGRTAEIPRLKQKLDAHQKRPPVRSN